LLVRCCHLGFPHPIWRHGALIGSEELFSLSLEYSEEQKILTVEVYGNCKEVHAWATLSKVLSVTIKMLSEFPGLPCNPAFLCPRHEKEENWMPIVKHWQARPGSRLIKEGDVCRACPNREAGKEFLAVALQVVEFSDKEFFDEQLREQFAEKAEEVDLEGRLPWPRSNREISTGQASVHMTRSNQIPADQPPNEADARSEVRTQRHEEMKKWVGVTSGSCLTVFAAFLGTDTGGPLLWGVFLGSGMLLLGVLFVLMVRERETTR
ncbi:unnamed protein product, partial [Sphacelaria rigidula]